MDRRNPSQRQLTAQYLLIYNLVNGFLWIAVLGRVILLIPLVGFQNVYGGVGEFAKWVQSIAILEVFHSALGTATIFLSKPCCAESKYGGSNIMAANGNEQGSFTRLHSQR